MSKLIDAMQIHSTGKRFAEIGKVAVVKTDSYTEFRPLPDLVEYRLEANIGVRIRCIEEDLKYVKEESERMVREEVFGEYRKALHQIRFAAYNRDFKEVDNLVSEIEANMFGDKL